MSVTVTRANITDPNITETTISNYITPSTNWTSSRHSGVVLGGQSHLIAEYTIAASAGNSLAPNGRGGNGINVWYNRNSANSAWEPYYNWSITDTYYTTEGNTGYIQSSNLKIYYTPPVGVPGLDPDPVSAEGGFSSNLHDIRFTYTERAIVAITNRLTSVNIADATVSPSSPNEIALSANATGTVALTVRKLNSDKDDYTHSYNFSTQAWTAKASGLQSYTVTFTEDTVKSGERISVIMPSTDESATYSIVMSAGTLALDSSIPDAINELNFETVQSVRNTFGPGTKTNVTNVTGTITTGYNPEMAYTNRVYPFTFVYTKSSGTMTLTRQPLASDVTGHSQITTVTGTVNSGVSTIITADTEGIKAGMYVKDGSTESGGGESLDSDTRIPANTVVNTISADTSFTIKSSVTGSAVVTTAAINGEPGGDQTVQLSSDWEFSFSDMVATINGGATAVTVTGNLTVLRYGRSAPDGDIKLQPNFITIS